MKHEEFEHKLRSHDPAANLEMRDTAEHRELLEQAISSQPANVISISKWTRQRKAISAAAAALLVVGFGGPVISGASSATPERLVFGMAADNSAGKMADSGLRSESMGKYSYDQFQFWGSYIYELSGDISGVATSAPVYKVVNDLNLDSRIKEIANYFNVKNLSESEYADGWAADNFWGFTSEGGASFSFYDASVDPWRDCYKEDQAITTDGEEFVCNPINDNLPSKGEAKNKALTTLKDLGIDTSDLQFEIWVNDYSVDVYAVRQLNGLDTPVNYYASYVSNGDLYSFGGALTHLVEIGTYDLVSVENAIKRANELTTKTFEAWQGNSGTESSPGRVGSSDSEDYVDADNGDSDATDSSPSDDSTSVTVDPSAPVFDFQTTTVKVTGVELSYQSFWMKDGTSLWLPVFNFIGTTETETVPTGFGSVVAIVDSQIDIDSLYGIVSYNSSLAEDMMVK